MSNNYTAIIQLDQIGGESVEKVASTLNFFQGDSVRIRFWIRDLSDRPLNLSGQTVSIDVGTAITGISPTIDVAKGGEGYFDLTAAQTAGLTAGTFKLIFDVTETSSSKVLQFTVDSALSVSTAPN